MKRAILWMITITVLLLCPLSARAQTSDVAQMRAACQAEERADHVAYIGHVIAVIAEEIPTSEQDMRQALARHRSTDPFDVLMRCYLNARLGPSRESSGSARARSCSTTWHQLAQLVPRRRARSSFGAPLPSGR